MLTKEPVALLHDIVGAAIARKVTQITIKQIEENYEISWRRGTIASSLVPVVRVVNRDAGEQMVKFIYDKSGLIPTGKVVSGHHVKSISFDLDERFSAAWSVFGMETPQGNETILYRIFPTPFESWQDLGLNREQISALKNSFANKDGVVCFNGVFHEQLAQATSRLALDELKRHRQTGEIAHVAELYFHPDSEFTARPIDVGRMAAIFEKNFFPPGAAVVIEPLVKYFITGTKFDEYFGLALRDERLVVCNSNYTKLEHFFNRVKSLAPEQIKMLRLVVHFEESREACPVHFDRTIVENFDPAIIRCEICLDTNTPSVDYNVRVMEMLPERAEALIEHGLYRDFMRLANERNWLI